MKRIIIVFALTLILAMPLTVSASADNSDDERNPIAITVVVPRPEGNQNEQPTAPQPAINHVYPVHVWESRENGRREIIRVYELSGDETSAQIRREPFERDGFRFELAEIVRREIPAHNVRDHTEVVEISTQTSDLETIIRLLSQTMEHTSDDGYFGVLTLDIASIRIESQGTTSSNFTATRTREFPHLSIPDTSLVPRTITEGGRTYNLATVLWNEQGSTPIDYRQIATTFTAIATYTRVGTRTSTIGYTTTAEYTGQISRIAVGRTEFTAHFIGIPIVTPIVGIGAIEPEMAENPAGPDPAPEQPTIVNVEQVQIGGIVIETEHIQPPQYEKPAEEELLEEYEKYAEEKDIKDDESSGFPIRTIAFALLFIIGIVLAYFAGKKGKAMLAGAKKASFVILACGLMLGVLEATAYAADLPEYGFGIRGAESAVHFDNRASAQNSNTFHANTEHRGASGDIHFDPRRFDVTARASPNFHPGGNAHNYNYGDVIGRLTVERTGRTINIIGGATMRAMDFGAGHFSFTGLNYGNTGLIGHNRGSNGFFSFVRQLREGDILTLYAGGILRSYSVSMLYTVDETDFSPLSQFYDHRLTLITCVEYQRTQRRVAVAIAVD